MARSGRKCDKTRAEKNAPSGRKSSKTSQIQVPTYAKIDLNKSHDRATGLERLSVAHALAAMKLLTHNMLQCHIKGVKNGYPFKIEAEKVETQEVDYDPDFLRHIYPRLQWPALCEAAAALGAGPLPAEVTPDMLENDDDFLQAFHHALLEVHLEEGALVCPETGRKFLVAQGIPNLLLQEDEV
jgi:multifunctional methyltransferase subunit TRM112